MQKFLFICAILVMPLLVFPQNSPATFKVKYLSSENVYLNGGSAQGLAIGDKLAIKKGKVVIAELKALFVAEYSSSCKILFQKGKIQTGDLAVISEKKEIQTTDIQKHQSQSKNDPKTKKRTSKRTKKRKSKPGGAKVSGSVSAQFYQQDDRTESNIDFSQPTVRLNLRAQNLWAKNYNLRIRTRTRYNKRSKDFSQDVPESEWRNRIYELSFSYDNDNSRFNYRLGRIISNQIGGIGYVDGLEFQTKLSQGLAFGILGGTQPDWRTSNFQTTIKKYGAYINYKHGNYRSHHFESTLAAAAEYHSSVISRENIYIQNNYSDGARFSLFQSAELDINRKWRKTKAGGNITLSSLFISSRLKFTDRVSAGIIFDNRKNYWTYEVRSVADSLFDDALRLGLRGNLSLRLPGNYRIQANAGFRKKETENEATYSYSGGIYQTKFLIKSLSLRLNYAGFSNKLTEGYNASVQIGQRLNNGVRLDVGYGTYNYTFSADNRTRGNQWVRVGNYVSLLRRLFISGEFEYNWGDDLDGRRYLVELGYRF